jgi:hypothetical protein
MPLSHETTPKAFGGYSGTRSLILERSVIKVCCGILELLVEAGQKNNISERPHAYCVCRVIV